MDTRFQGTLTKIELAKKINQELGFSVRSSKSLVDDLFNILIESLNSGEKVKIIRFGSFLPLLKKSRMGINPNTKEKIIISARKTVAFRPSPILKKGVNAGKRSEILQDWSSK